MPPSSFTLLENQTETAPDWAFRGARQAALTYPETAADQDDEFLGWFLGVTRGRPADPRSARFRAGVGAIARLSGQLPKLPSPEAVQRVIAEWARGDARLGGWLAAGVPTERALARWGTSRLQSNQMPLAVAAFRAATALSPRDPGAWSNYGVALDLSGSLPEAAACLERSLFLSAQQAHTWLQLGMVRKKMGDPAGAEAAYRAALEQEATNAVAWQCLGLLKEEQLDIPGAIDCYLASIENGGGGSAISANLGKLCYRIGRLTEAQQAYAEAARGERDNAGFQRMYRRLTFIRQLMEHQSADSAIETFRKSRPSWDEEDRKELREIMDMAFGILTGFGHKDAARKVGAKHVELWPGEPTMKYLLSALEGGAEDRSPPAYIVEHFDRFADTFDSQLVGALGYDLPEKIRKSLRSILAKNRVDHALDAGCGTGLCGPVLRPLSARLTGVDLSSKMLERARDRGVYDSLVCDDLLGFLGRHPRTFDLIVAADVMIYFGDLGSVLASAAFATRPGGWLIFSTENLTGEGNYRLQASGRFAHAPEYVQQTAGPEFALASCTDTTLRLEGTHRVPGHLFVFRRL